MFYLLTNGSYIYILILYCFFSWIDSYQYVDTKIQKNQKKVIFTYLIHVLSINTIALCFIIINYITTNLASDKKTISSSYYIHLKILLFLIIIFAIVKFITFVYTLMYLFEGKNKVVGFLIKIVLIFSLLLISKSIIDFFYVKNNFILGDLTKYTDIGIRILIFIISFYIFIKSFYFLHSGKKTVIQGFSLLYLITHLLYLVFFFLNINLSFLSLYFIPIHYIILNLSPILFLNKYSDYHFGKKLVFSKLETDFVKVLTKYKITKREAEIVQLICDGKKNKEIEEVLFISIKTVKYHIFNIYRKLNVKSRLELMNVINDLKETS